MHDRLRTLLQPLNLAAMLTLATVAMSLSLEAGLSMSLATAVIVAYLLAFLAIDTVPPHRGVLRAMLYAVLAACAYTLVWLAPRTGTAPVLLVVTIAALTMDYPPRRILALAVVMNLGLYLVLRQAGHAAPAMAVAIYLGFQAFAGLIAHYARTAERARDALARVNADLLATRALLAESARDGERLRVARELHDVAGHKLTAMTLNLRALAVDPALGGRHELAIARQMADELLADIRNVVHALRDPRGLDLSTALQALAAPLPRPRLRLRLDPALHVTDPALADTVLRVVQEALTNSARHSRADTLHVALTQDAAQPGLWLRIEDDGQVRLPLREGNGLAGMRERVASAGGTLALSAGDRGALCIDVRLPA